MQSQHQVIETFVDNGLEWFRQKDLLLRPDPDMPAEMYDDSRKSKNDWKPWKPIPGLVTDDDILQIENQIGHKYPDSYKEFLKYKHFYELHSAGPFRPFQHVIHRWKETLLSKYNDPELQQYMLDQGYIWFGDYEDWGFLCFDTKTVSENNEYPVILIDHETVNLNEVIYSNFLECCQKNTVTL